MYKFMHICFFLIGFYCCSTPESAYKAAKKHSDLKIKETYKILDYIEEYSFTGSGVIYIVFQLNDKDLKGLVTASKRKKYKTISIKNLIDDGFIDADPRYGINLYTRDIRQIAKGVGYYKLRTRNLKKLDFSITILDVTNKELIIYVNIP